MRIFGIGKLCGSEKHEMDRDKVVHCRGRRPRPRIGAAESRIFCAGCGLSRWPAPAEWSTRHESGGSGVRISSGAPSKTLITNNIPDVYSKGISPWAIYIATLSPR
jgi:hypothetical protein